MKLWVIFLIHCWDYKMCEYSDIVLKLLYFWLNNSLKPNEHTEILN